MSIMPPPGADWPHPPPPPPPPARSKHAMIRIYPSSLDRYAACPGSYKAELGMPYTDSEWADEGRRLHAALATGDESQLTVSQRRDISFCRTAGRDLYEWVGRGADYRREQKLSLAERSFELSGRADFAAWKDDRCLVIDWKFGREAVDPAESNMQLRAYAVLAAADLNPAAEQVRVAIVQPRSDEPRVQICDYTREEVGFAKAEIASLAETIAGDCERIPGPRQCKYCKALGTLKCPESVEASEHLLQVNMSHMPAGQDLAGLLDKAVVVEDLIGRLRDHAKQLLESGSEVPGWELRSGPYIRTLPDIERAWSACDGHLSPEEFMRACKVSITALQDVLTEKKRWSAKQSKEATNEMLGTAIVVEMRSASLKRKA